MDLPYDIVRHILHRADLSIDTRRALGVPPKRLLAPPPDGLQKLLRVRAQQRAMGETGAHANVHLRRGLEPYAHSAKWKAEFASMLRRCVARFKDTRDDTLVKKGKFPVKLVRRNVKTARVALTKSAADDVTVALNRVSFL